MKTQYDVCVVGGGAAGMAAAIAAAEGGNTVCIIDKNKKLGKKLYATGNGRCNLANTDMKDGHYHSSSETYQKFLHTCLGEQPLHEMFAFLHSIGVYTRCIDGYYYPISMQASAVVWALLDRIKALQVTTYLSETVKQVSRLTPNEWIDNYVILEIRVLLKNSTRSIKEIAMEMNFPNQSFLGKFFKERVGMSPSEYRKG